MVSYMKLGMLILFYDQAILTTHMVSYMKLGMFILFYDQAITHHTYGILHETGNVYYVKLF